MVSALDRYLLRQILGPLVMTLAIAALLLILERMLRLFDFVVNQGGPVDVVFMMLANLAPHYMGLALPIGLFLGVLVAFRKLSLSSELDAMQATGVSLPRMMRPILGLSLVLMIINILLTGWIQPVSRYAYRGLVFDLRSGALGAAVRVGEFVDIGDNAVLRIEESRNEGQMLLGVFLERTTDQGRISVSAERGRFVATDNPQIILLRLEDGVLMDLTSSETKPRVLSFASQDLTLRLPEPEAFRARGGEEREYTLPELYTRQFDTELEREFRLAIMGQFHWRLMHSLSFLVLPILAVPMGIAAKRSTSSTGIVVGLSLVIVYNELMEVMQGAVAKGNSPFGTIWLLFGLFLALSYAFFRISAFKVGGEPLKLINRMWAKVAGPISTLLRRVMGVDA